MPIRSATHAGSWYTDDGKELARQLSGWLGQVPSSISGIAAVSSQLGAFQLPPGGARAIIAPHAGYSYSGPAAAWAYKAVDLSNTKRVFLLGPSHHAYLSGCALSKCDKYETPLGDLEVDKATVSELHGTKQFEWMSQSVDEAEHSLEMHLPYIYKILSDHFGEPSKFPPLTPILVGATSAATEKRYGRLLAPYLADSTSVFVVSSDFCHWGSRFRYTYYVPDAGKPYSLTSRDGGKKPKEPRIHESIAKVDRLCMDAAETGRHDEFLRVLGETENTVCGRHPIGVVMAAVEVLRDEGKLSAPDSGQFRFVRYERSSDCETVRDSSVSYCSAFATF